MRQQHNVNRLDNKFRSRSGCFAKITAMVLLVRLLVATVLLAGVSYAQSDVTDPVIYGSQVLREINDERARQALPALQLDDDLLQLAGEWARHLASSDEFRHRPDLLERATALGFTSITENVWRADQPLPPQRVVSTWLESPGHAKNIRSRRSKVGAVAVAFADSGRIIVVFNGGTPPKMNTSM